MPEAEATCPHVKEIRKVTPSGKGCKECLEMGDTWTCGNSSSVAT